MDYRLTLKDRAGFYNSSFPDYPPLMATDRWLYGMWVIGNYYRNKSSFYGAYPHSYLDRMMSLFPDAKNILHLFSGSLDSSVRGIRFDINPELHPDVVGNAEDLRIYFAQEKDLIFADPPYSNEDATHYGTPMINRNRVVSECCEVLESGGFLVWLDQILPMYRKTELQLVGSIGIVRSTNHRFRVASIFRRS